MVVCADCRTALVASDQACTQCGWLPISKIGLLDYLSSKDRASAETAEYMEVYDALAERNLARQATADDHVEGMAAACVRQLGPLADMDVCDVGAGRGYFVKHAIRAGAKSVTAVDIAAPTLKVIADTHGVCCFLANAENLPFEREFDVLVATDIVEHVLNVSNFLVTANWSLRDNGRLLVRVPYLEDMMDYSNFFGLPMHYTHLRTFDRKVIVHTVETAGFIVEKVYYDDFRVDHIHRIWNKFPKLRKRLYDYLSNKHGYGSIRSINENFLRIIIKPIEVGVVARKANHLQKRNNHGDLIDFYQSRIIYKS
jgi:2-polyprenyl-3-methyl-5-hydroxy-6-metoxy-1,4-benzoquinol methylase